MHRNPVGIQAEFITHVACKSMPRVRHTTRERGIPWELCIGVPASVVTLNREQLPHSIGRKYREMVGVASGSVIDWLHSFLITLSTTEVC